VATGVLDATNLVKENEVVGPLDVVFGEMASKTVSKLWDTPRREDSGSESQLAIVLPRSKHLRLVIWR
jgi:hypothetical protein